MSQNLTPYAAQQALKRDLVWAILWRISGGEHWVTSRAVYDAWREGRDECGIVWADDWIGSTQHFSRALMRLVADHRAERRKLPHKHPTYRAVGAVIHT